MVCFVNTYMYTYPLGSKHYPAFEQCEPDVKLILIQWLSETKCTVMYTISRTRFSHAPLGTTCTTYLQEYITISHKVNVTVYCTSSFEHCF